MRSVICVHEGYERNWSFTADHWHKKWQEEGGSELYRSENPDARITQLVPNPEEVQRLVILGFPAESEDLTPFSALEECYWDSGWTGASNSGIEEAEARGVNLTRSPASSTDGGILSELNISIGVRPINCQPPGLAIG